VLNVLSVDWDYFIDATDKDRLMYFPDVPNENYPKAIQDTIWSSLYANNDKLASFGVDPVVQTFLRELPPVSFVCMAESHKYAYPFIVDQMEARKENRINLLNIDFHSDCREDNETLDCGNWLSMLMNRYKGKYRWLGRKGSSLSLKPARLSFSTDYRSVGIAKTKWDVLFICRSDMWSPPHLDDSFTRCFRPLTKSVDGYVQQDIWQSRMEKMEKAVKQLKDVYETFHVRNKVTTL
jgi:hypothetical protein